MKVKRLTEWSDQTVMSSDRRESRHLFSQSLKSITKPKIITLLWTRQPKQLVISELGGGNYQTPELNVIDLQIEGAICFDSTVSGNGSFGDLNQGDDL